MILSITNLKTVAINRRKSNYYNKHTKMNFKLLFLVTLLSAAYVNTETTAANVCIYSKLNKLSPSGKSFALKLLRGNNRVLFETGRRTPVLTTAAVLGAAKLIGFGAGATNLGIAGSHGIGKGIQKISKNRQANKSKRQDRRQDRR